MLISIIVCHRDPEKGRFHQRQIEETIGCDHEYIGIDNHTGQYGLCAAYNEGLNRCSGQICVMIHDDLFFLQKDWGKILIDKFKKDDSLGLIGLAGTQFLEGPSWIDAGQPFIQGRVVHDIKKDNLLVLSHYSKKSGEDVEVVAVDGLFMAVRKSVFNEVRFDDKTFDQYHFYDLDLCMQVKQSYKMIVTHDILAKHLSGGRFDPLWETYARRFQKKYAPQLPAACTGLTPHRTAKEQFNTFDLNRLLSKKEASELKTVEHKAEILDQINFSEKFNVIENTTDKGANHDFNQELFNLIPKNLSRVLEIGCGCGFMADLYRKTNPGVHYCGVESNPSEAGIARSHNRIDQVITGDVEKISLIREGIGFKSLDGIIYTNGLEHFSDPWEVLRTHQRLLVPGGSVLACMSNAAHWSIIYNLMQDNWRYQSKGILNHNHLRFFTLQSIKELFRQANLTIFTIQTRQWVDDSYHTFLEMIAPALKNLNLDPEIFSTHARAFQYVILAKKS